MLFGLAASRLRPVPSTWATTTLASTAKRDDRDYLASPQRRHPGIELVPQERRMEAALPWPLRRRARVRSLEASLRTGNAPRPRYRARPASRRRDDSLSAGARTQSRAGG